MAINQTTKISLGLSQDASEGGGNFLVGSSSGFVRDLNQMRSLPSEHLEDGDLYSVSSGDRSGHYRWVEGDSTGTIITGTINTSGVDDTNYTFTSAGHGLDTGDGLLVLEEDSRFSTSDVYWVVRVDSSTFSLASTYEDAFDGNVEVFSGTNEVSFGKLLDPFMAAYVTLDDDLQGSLGYFRRVGEYTSVSFDNSIKPMVNVDLNSAKFVKIDSGEHPQEGTVQDGGHFSQAGFLYKGVNKFTTALTSDNSDFLFKTRGPTRFDNVTLSQVGASGQGVAIGATDSFQTAFSGVEDCKVEDFRYGIWRRYSLWDAYRDLELRGNTCGIRLARADYQTDNSNPDAPGAWNFDPGWFNNALTLDNILCEGGEVGLWAASMGAVLINFTAQGQDTDGTSNDVLPSGQKGTGVFFESGADGVRNGWHNQVVGLYSENTEIGAYVKDQRAVTIQGMFMQGGASSDRAEAALIADNSNVTINDLVGQDFVEKIIEAKNGSVVYVNSDGYGPLSATNRHVVDETSRIKLRGWVDRDKYEYRMQKTSASDETFTIPENVPDKSVANLYINALYNGFSPRTGVATIYKWGSGITPEIEWQSGSPPNNVSVTVSNSGAVSVTYSGTQSMDSHVILHIVGGTDVSSTEFVLQPD